MSHLSDLPCSACGGTLERVRFFTRQLLTADDLTIEQDYFRQKLRRHNRLAHGWGVVCGCTVEAAPEAGHPWQVRVCPGYVLTPQGDEVLIAEPVLFDLATGAQQDEPCAPCPCPPNPQPSPTQDRQTVYLAVRYSECSTRPVRVHPAGCGCDDAACEYARVRDDFCLAVLWELPECYKQITAQENAWLAKFKALKTQGTPTDAPAVFEGVPVPDCPCCPNDPWVILASIKLPAHTETPLVSGDIQYAGRRVLYSTSAIQFFTLTAWQEKTMPTVLAFNTPPGAALIPIGQRILLGHVDVSKFREIRVLAVGRPNFTGPLGVILEYALPGWTPAWLDVIDVATGARESRTYVVPGIGLNVYADAARVTAGAPAIDVLLFGGA